ncbi:sensor histidine kinase [Anaeroselena agilis]|uniref:histidine kinase n=1 Tax=Anaeroselena agilis TaxID=3063788 RepID=A0ABU3P2X2_9FIRM|nr:HAMP domain-containing sensor histidine kinase [Selenomonadales bacterium 4137-cl]
MSLKMINYPHIFSGLGLILLGLLAPAVLSVKGFGIIPLLERSVLQASSGALLTASLKLVALNTLRALPIYIGTLLIAQGLGVFRAGAHRYLLYVLPLAVIPAAYEAIKLIYGIAYDFGIPAISLTLAIFLMSRLENMTRKVFHKILVLALLLFGVEWLDTVPLLSGYWFGRGEISTDLKKIAAFLEAEEILNITGIALFIICTANSFILARLLSVYTKELKVAEQVRLDSELKLRTLENRSLREVQSLVHDLKTPLTSIQGLAGVLTVTVADEPNRQYAARIVEASDKMSSMISELLRDDTRQVISSRELAEYAAAHVPGLSGLRSFCIEAVGLPPAVAVNKIKMSRAIVNLLENAMEAVSRDDGQVRIRLSAKDCQAVIEITDNGFGIPVNQSRLVWEPGFSTKNSSGFGLPFVRETVETNGGTIVIDSADGKGTRVIITLPEVAGND